MLNEYLSEVNGSLHMSWSYGPRLSADWYLPCLPSFLLFEVFLPSHSTWNPVCVVKWKTEFPEIKVVAQEKGTATANWHIQAISKVASSNFAAVNTAPWFSPGSTSTNVSPWKKITKDMRVLPAHIFFILNDLFKFIRALASSFVHASLSTEGQKKLI